MTALSDRCRTEGVRFEPSTGVDLAPRRPRERQACGERRGRAISGPYFGWSDTWQLVINTGTTIVTFLMVFLIQHTQRRDTQAIHLKLDELIRVNLEARNELIKLEDMSEEELETIQSAMADVADTTGDCVPAGSK
jgi:hypothetical protein